MKNISQMKTHQTTHSAFQCPNILPLIEKEGVYRIDSRLSLYDIFFHSPIRCQVKGHKNMNNISCFKKAVSLANKYTHATITVLSFVLTTEGWKIIKTSINSVSLCGRMHVHTHTYLFSSTVRTVIPAEDGRQIEQVHKGLMLNRPGGMFTVKRYLNSVHACECTCTWVCVCTSLLLVKLEKMQKTGRREDAETKENMEKMKHSNSLFSL